MGDMEDPNALPPGIAHQTFRPRQRWTLDGYPIVNGKYHDLAVDEIKAHTGVFRGPPTAALSVYWNNCASSDQPDHFYAMGCTSGHAITEYLARVGEMLKQGKCKVVSLNATQYAVNVIVLTDLSSGDFLELLRQYGLNAAA